MPGGTPRTPQATVDAPRRRPRPRNAATLVIVDRSVATPRILMGRRRPDQIFLPDKYVFPGGRVERADAAIATGDELDAVDRVRLLLAVAGRPSPKLPHALALAAIRETFEETGILIGAAPATSPAEPTPAHGPWTGFLAHGLLPRLSGLRFFARAITPPGRPRRYDTRFFMVDASAIAHKVEKTDGELSSLDWVTVPEAHRLDLPSITRTVLGDLALVLETSNEPATLLPVPFYVHRHGRFERRLLDHRTGDNVLSAT